MFGELLAESCLAHGVAGLVIDAGVRDTTRAHRARISRLVQSRVGAGHVEDDCRQRQRPDRLRRRCQSPPATSIVGDADGVVVVPRAAAQSVVAAVDQRLAKEERTRERLKAGELGLDIYGLRDVLAQRGVVWRDE